ncbi:MAG TPA: glycolate oxidase subunit GlcE [Burkholderiales bacterium]|nr:glycolate oxidase subunit GlcE [Burkholderiales bacterium]
MSLEDLQERVREAAGRGAALRIRGGGSKDFYGNLPRGEVLDTRGCAGIVAYEPTELVLTARCGTALSDLEGILADQGQFLPFEPPHFGPGATLGGCVAAGLSGPRRASGGAVRDAVLGARILDGRGQLLAFGGQVMKNVAGYDVSRLLAGSLGTLGVIVEVSLKLLPRPAAERTRRFEMTQAQALQSLNRWAGQPLPVSASAWRDGALTLRLSGAESAIGAAAQKLGGESMVPEEATRLWSGIREQTDAFFAGDAPLWRLSLPSAAPELSLAGAQLVEWGGALRWLRGDLDAAQVRAAAARAGGHATLFRAKDKSAGAFAPLPPLLARLHRELKRSFDPAGILNPGRLYPEF